MADAISATSQAAKQTDSTTQPSPPLQQHEMCFVINVEKSSTSENRAIRALLSCLDTSFEKDPASYVIDKSGVKLKTTKHLHDSTTYGEHFSLQRIQKTKFRGDATDQYVAIATIFSRFSFYYLRMLLSKTKWPPKTRVSIYSHAWEANDHDIVQVGFIQGVDPSNYLKGQCHEELRLSLSDCNHNQPPPMFNCEPTSPMFVATDGIKFKTRAYTIECRRKDAKNLIPQLHAFNELTNKLNKVVFYKLRHENPIAFKEAILEQAKFLRDTRVIPIEGVSLDLMAQYKDDIEALDGIDEVLFHKDMETKGRWNLLTDYSRFRSAIQTVEEFLPTLTEAFLEIDVDSSLPFPGLSFRKHKTPTSTIPFATEIHPSGPFKNEPQDVPTKVVKFNSKPTIRTFEPIRNKEDIWWSRAELKQSKRLAQHSQVEDRHPPSPSVAVSQSNTSPLSTSAASSSPIRQIQAQLPEIVLTAVDPEFRAEIRTAIESAMPEILEVVMQKLASQFSN